MSEPTAALRFAVCAWEKGEEEGEEEEERSLPILGSARASDRVRRATRVAASRSKNAAKKGEEREERAFLCPFAKIIMSFFLLLPRFSASFLPAELDPFLFFAIQIASFLFLAQSFWPLRLGGPSVCHCST